MIKRGEIYFANLDPVVGSEISKTRPVLIISNNTNNEFSSLVTVIPLTKLKSRKVYPFEILLNSDAATIPYDSILKVNQIRTIDKARLKNRIADVEQNILFEIEKAVCIHLEIDI